MGYQSSPKPNIQDEQSERRGHQITQFPSKPPHVHDIHQAPLQAYQKLGLPPHAEAQYVIHTPDQHHKQVFQPALHKPHWTLHKRSGYSLHFPHTHCGYSPSHSRHTCSGDASPENRSCPLVEGRMRLRGGTHRLWEGVDIPLVVRLVHCWSWHLMDFQWRGNQRLGRCIQVDHT